MALNLLLFMGYSLLGGSQQLHNADLGVEGDTLFENTEIIHPIMLRDNGAWKEW